MRAVKKAAAALMLLASVPAAVYADGSIPMDYNSNGAVDIFDMVSARKSGKTASELKALSSFLLGSEAGETANDGYELVWSDEFGGSSLDETKWSYELGNWKLDDNGNYITNGWGNNEQEYYTSKNTSVKDGILTISARRENLTDEKQGSYEYTSARINTHRKFSVCGGRIEVRARCDSGKSLWPAIWMLPEDNVYGGWAASGEIDIMEGWGSTPEKICGTVHFGNAWPDNKYLTGNYEFRTGDSSANWHTYSIEWESGEIRWYVDGKLYSTQTEWYSEGFKYPAPFDQNFYIILNLAVGGHFDGIDGIYADPNTFADGDKNFDIDYVRVYEKKGSNFVPAEMSSMSLDNYIEGADASVVNKDGCTVINVRNAGELEYAVMGLLRGRNVKAGEKHTLSFDVSSTAERSMVVTAEDSSYTRYLDKKLTITPERKHYSFDVPFENDMAVDLKFQLGNIDGAGAVGAHEVTLYNIKWD
ncbi:MAG: glycoside hydrolase family 16 protein [Ruminococcus sp.]|uniref:glycoside hydrolase family 16 protein n=1 Tax=Ruminococcus sp. TaxID=41978 RepID=UPI0025E35A6E|nr:glycoside hydrolase family 16 protein [Ruminococcus sp.]MCR5599953.1 glycoside hydrolase family 16 protein [Ruminococcus sp.]